MGEPTPLFKRIRELELDQERLMSNMAKLKANIRKTTIALQSLNRSMTMVVEHLKLKEVIGKDEEETGPEPDPRPRLATKDKDGPDSQGIS